MVEKKENKQNFKKNTKKVSKLLSEEKLKKVIGGSDQGDVKIAYKCTESFCGYEWENRYRKCDFYERFIDERRWVKCKKCGGIAVKVKNDME